MWLERTVQDVTRRHLEEDRMKIRHGFASCSIGRAAVLWLAGLATLFTACTPAEPPEISAGIVAGTTCPDRSDGNYFFPAESIGAPPAVVDGWLVPVYSQLLTLSDASPLWCGDSFSEAYRLLILPAFDAPLVVELIRSGRQWRVTSATYSGAALRLEADNATTIVLKQVARKPIGQDAAERFLQHLDQIRYWSIPSFKKSGTADATGVTVEGRRGRSYRVVTRFSGDNDPLEESARILIGIVGIELPSALKVRS